MRASFQTFQYEEKSAFLYLIDRITFVAGSISARIFLEREAVTQSFRSIANSLREEKKQV